MAHKSAMTVQALWKMKMRLSLTKRIRNEATMRPTACNSQNNATINAVFEGKIR